jgi:hypothetical protein
VVRRFAVYSKTGWPVLFLGAVFLLSSPPCVLARELTEGIVRNETAQGYKFMSGGVGTEERNEMMQQANQYDLALSFAARSGDYLSDVNVVITDDRGKEIVNTTTAGPLFYAELPGGRYNIKATYDGHSEEIKGIQIHNGRRFSRLLHWNVPDK